jgi:hypothetical protein
MHGPINVKSPNNISKWQMGYNSAFIGLMNIKEKTDCSFPVRRAGRRLKFSVGERTHTLKRQIDVTEKQQIQTVSWIRSHIPAFSKMRTGGQWRNYFI